MKNSPVFLLTMGDPAGIGPEIALKALSESDYFDKFRVVIVGDLSVLQYTAKKLNQNCRFNEITEPCEAVKDRINVISLNVTAPHLYTPGKPQAICGKAAFSYIRKAIQLTIEKKACGVITNPISKESLKLAEIPFPGHTEIFAHYTSTTNYSMVFLLHDVAVAHVTTHCSLREAIEQINEERVLKQIRLLNKTLKQLGNKEPLIAVSGLNPHAGENGLFGREEIETINPAIKRGREENIMVTGPYPPDTVFMRAFRGEFNGVVSMLHDHGFVALKSMDFYRGVNITVGLPIIRTSVGHGTAFDLALKGIASQQSLISAIETAWKLFHSRS
ncbi:4-hydroxythreonine-4-phosphate dehydrogenase PdxA [Chitinispirillales bacterium ANBcel5]|uniref:4-hydroxythreonine-4-phosphate dehydrogenase PdxA n=1 Tax=Cellulosispirillum alkaliphilum TaxID=3039283 RepID=UPI002A4FEC67|nr:4-hydroxythreonine-4-phosphate dehydrogenase PdxA [Chitinispirillales bacterium ANBcel5]